MKITYCPKCRMVLGRTGWLNFVKFNVKLESEFVLNPVLCPKHKHDEMIDRGFDYILSVIEKAGK